MSRYSRGVTPSRAGTKKLTRRYAPRRSNVKDSSVVAVQVFDQRKFKRKDQGFLGVINIKVADVIDLDSGGQGEFMNHDRYSPRIHLADNKDDHP